MYELLWYLANVAAMWDLPSPVGAHKRIVLYPDFNASSISRIMLFWSSRGMNPLGETLKHRHYSISMYALISDCFLPISMASQSRPSGVII